MSENDTSAPERIWAWPWNGETRRGQWSISGDLTGEQEYVRADLYDAMRERAEKAEAERGAATDTLKAWFDRRALAHGAIDEAVLDAVRGYLRRSRVGGMDRETSDMIEGVVADMARLSGFADLFARAALRNEGGDDGR